MLRECEDPLQCPGKISMEGRVPHLPWPTVIGHFQNVLSLSSKVLYLYYIRHQYFAYVYQYFNNSRQNSNLVRAKLNCMHIVSANWFSVVLKLT